MPPRARHPEVLALALIVLALGFGADPRRAGEPVGECGCQIAEFGRRLADKLADLEVRLGERLAEIGERLGSRLTWPAMPGGRLR
jgi:hypothetical protein